MSLRLLTTIYVVGISIQSVIAAVVHADASRPNIVFIIADDLGWADVAFHGGNAPTPNLDQLAKDGVELTQHYVAPVCSPTRTGLLTGRCWSRFGITTPTNALALPSDTVTLAGALGSCGYDTCLVGKWHLGSKPEWAPNHYGFEHSYGSLAGGVTAWSHRYKQGPFSVTWHRNGKLLEEEGHVTDLLADEAVTWIENRGDKPFFLYVPFTAVHLPINEPKSWLDKVPTSITSEIGRHYAACVMHLDDAVGRILHALDERGVRENTLVVFTSDNGGSTTTNNTQPYPPDDSPSGNLTANNGSLRGQKGNVYEGGTRVPTIVSWPGKISQRHEPTPVFIADWMPTFCQLAGYQSDRDLHWDGISLSSLLLKAESIPQRPIYIAGPHWRAVSLRLGDWKLVVSENDRHELFDIAIDPSEQTNLAKQEPDRLKDMLAALKQVRATDNDSVVK
ncbi:MAG: sulfatase-like hydrolase/transferase [Planctomycetaceae bacterium]|nr:sulfatase-like hydrolase/transferase [Planctomycetales bacterium]MCB9926381.1 sulfatase-like hydrolase/transferase [Planctomycetaceae bacterium]